MRLDPDGATRLTEKSHLAALGAVLSAKTILKVDGKVDCGQMQTSVWSVADNRYIIPTQAAGKLQSKLKFRFTGSITLTN